MILGADLNLGRGRAERTWRLLVEAGFGSGLPRELPAGAIPTTPCPAW